MSPPLGTPLGTDVDALDFLLTVETDETVRFAPKLVPRLVRPPSTVRAVLGVV